MNTQLKCKGNRVRFEESIIFSDCLRNGEIEAVKKYISSKTFSPNYTLESGSSALHLAVESGNLELVSYLIKCGANVNEQDEEGWTPLHLSAYLGDIEGCLLLLSHSSDPTIASKEGELPSDVTDDESIIQVIQSLTSGCHLS